MFDLKNCVNYDGKIFCWYPLTNSIVQIELKSVPIKDCPEAVVEALLKSAFGEGKKKD